MVNLKSITELPLAESVNNLNLIVNDNGSAKQIAASALGATGTACMQPDWNQNDSTANNYIKNRTHYEEVIDKQVTIQIGALYTKEELGLNESVDDAVRRQLETAKYEIEGKECTYVRKDEGIGPFYVSDGVREYKLTTAARPQVDAYYSGISFFDYSDKTKTGTVTFVATGTQPHKLDAKYLPDSVTNRKPYVIDSEAYTYGDDALAAILEGRQILVKVPNKNGETIFSNFMPVLQYQLPNINNNYLILFYLKDGIAENIMTAMQTSSFDGVYGVIEMMLSETYAECPLKVNPVK